MNWQDRAECPCVKRMWPQAVQATCQDSSSSRLARLFTLGVHGSSIPFEVVEKVELEANGSSAK
eukprot:6094898-Amphidinium_carterae.1